MNNSNFSFEVFAGKNFVAIKTGEKVLKISFNRFGVKISGITINDLLTPEKVYSVNKNRNGLLINRKQGL